MNRFLALTLLTFGCFLAIACGSSEEDEPESAPQSQVQTQQQVVDPKADWPDTFRLGLFGQDDAEEVVTEQQAMKNLLEEALGIPVEIFTGTSYSAVIEAMRADRVEAMTVGPFAYVLAVQEAQAEALAVGVSNRDTPEVDDSILPYYFSVVFTKKGNGIESVEDIRGQGFNFVDPASTSGHLAPKTLLIKLGYDPDNDFQTVFAGSHPTSVISVWNDKAPAGATHEGNLLALDNEGQVDWCNYTDGKVNVPRTQEEIDAHFDSCPDGSIVVLAQSDPIPNTPFAIRSNLPESLKQAVKQALLGTTTNQTYIADRSACETCSTPLSWYVDPAPALGLDHLDQFYNPLRDIARLLNLDLKELAEGG
jgi:phosphonate transport system substrate-binding protein